MNEMTDINNTGILKQHEMSTQESFAEDFEKTSNIRTTNLEDNATVDTSSHSFTVNPLNKDNNVNEGNSSLIVDVPARIAVYDDLLSSPRIIDIKPNTTREYINDLATQVYRSAKESGGLIPYSIILQVAENFIHARFTEVIVTVLDGGNTIRFSDQGPGIPDKKKAVQPGFSSATSEMKRVINGVGSGLPIVSEYMETTGGYIEIEDNIVTGSVVTISLVPNEKSPTHSQEPEQKHNESFNTIENSRIQRDIPEGLITHRKTQEKVFKNRTLYDFKDDAVKVVSPAVNTTPVSATPNELLRATLSERGINILELFRFEPSWRVTDISNTLEMPQSTVHNELKKLEEAGMITTLGRKRIITELGAYFLNEEL